MQTTFVLNKEEHWIMLIYRAQTASIYIYVYKTNFSKLILLIFFLEILKNLRIFFKPIFCNLLIKQFYLHCFNIIYNKLSQLRLNRLLLSHINTYTPTLFGIISVRNIIYHNDNIAYKNETSKCNYFEYIINCF